MVAAGCDVNATDDSGKTCLRCLLDMALGPWAGADADSGTGGRQDCTDWAALARALLEAGADPFTRIDAPGADQGTASHREACLNHFALVAIAKLVKGRALPASAPQVVRCVQYMRWAVMAAPAPLQTCLCMGRGAAAAAEVVWGCRPPSCGNCVAECAAAVRVGWQRATVRRCPGTLRGIGFVWAAALPQSR